MLHAIPKLKPYKRLSPEELRGFKGFENLTECEAEKMIETLESFSIIMYELLNKQKFREDESEDYIKQAA